jgi:hypothetical protein
MKILSVFLLTSILIAAEGLKQNQGAAVRTITGTEWKFFDANTLVSTIANDGPYNDYRRTGSSGLLWPKGGQSYAVFTSGLTIVGRHRSTNNLRTSVQYYSTEFQPGPINGTYNTTTNDPSVSADRNDTTYRTYKISHGDSELTNPDYADWPGDLGAPYNDINGNGQWDKETDTPKMYGDQTLWQVINDLDTAAHRTLGTTAPMGIEVQAMYYGFDRPGALGNTMFMKWKIINKSDAHYDSTFIGFFSDVDMGEGNDDYDGYDSTLSLAYVYNADNDDASGSGYGSTPPSVGTVFLGGIPGLVPYAYPVWVKGWTGINDWNMGQATCPQEVFNYSRGVTKMGTPNINPLTEQPVRFAFTGDPVTNQGWTKENTGYYNPADVRSFVSLGPITLAPGDTQEVNAAFIIARSTDRLASITLLRQYTDTVRTAFGNNFVTSLHEREALPIGFQLEQNHPNPFNPSTAISYILQERSVVSLTIYNTLGQLVATAVQGVRNPGRHEHRFTAAHLPSGIYFYRLEGMPLHNPGKRFVDTRKMILLK